MERPEWLSASGLSYTRMVSREVGPAVNALKGCVGPSGWVVSHRCDSRQRGLREKFSTWFLGSVEGHVRSPAYQNPIYSRACQRKHRRTTSYRRDQGYDVGKAIYTDNLLIYGPCENIFRGREPASDGRAKDLYVRFAFSTSNLALCNSA